MAAQPWWSTPRQSKSRGIDSKGCVAQCFATWVKAKGAGAVTCVYCRAAWPNAHVDAGLGASAPAAGVLSAGRSSSPDVHDLPSPICFLLAFLGAAHRRSLWGAKLDLDRCSAGRGGSSYINLLQQSQTHASTDTSLDALYGASAVWIRHHQGNGSRYHAAQMWNALR